MALDVSSIAAHSPIQAARAKAVQLAMSQEQKKDQKPAADLGTVMADLQRVGATFNHRLSFSMNEKLGQVVVKVVDSDTDTVVKEIPAEELQRVYERIREVIGLLLDKEA